MCAIEESACIYNILVCCKLWGIVENTITDQDIGLFPPNLKICVMQRWASASRMSETPYRPSLLWLIDKSHDQLRLGSFKKKQKHTPPSVAAMLLLSAKKLPNKL